MILIPSHLGLTPNLAMDSSGYLENAWIFQNPTEEILAEDRLLADKELMEEGLYSISFS